MATYVILHGATAGGWFMGKVARRLRQAGHEAFTPTFTGLGERSHLINREINLDTHIQDVVNVFKYEDLSDVILVGKSYSGMVITGVAEAIPERISHLVYLDAFVPQDGQSIADLVGAEIADGFKQAAQAYGDGWRLPADLSVDPRLTDHPLQTAFDPVTVNNPKAAVLPRTFICCTARPDTFPFSPILNEYAKQAKQADDWRYRELPTDHEPERDMPDELTELLLELA